MVEGVDIQISLTDADRNLFERSDRNLVLLKEQYPRYCNSAPSPSRDAFIHDTNNTTFVDQIHEFTARTGASFENIPTDTMLRAIDMYIRIGAGEHIYTVPEIGRLPDVVAKVGEFILLADSDEMTRKVDPIGITFQGRCRTALTNLGFQVDGELTAKNITVLPPHQ